MKRKLTHLIFLVMVLSLVFASCNGNINTDTNTNTDAGETNTDTSSSSGTNTGTSGTETNTNVGTSTGTNTDTDTDVLPHEHIEEIISAVAPTCSQAGLTEGKKCSVCGEVLVEQETVDALGHTEEILSAVAPTCSKTGLTEGKKCSVCGEVLVEQVMVNALDHGYITNEAKAPTCEEIGWEEYQTCSRCDYTTYNELPANGHSYDGGYVCLGCGNTLASSEGLSFQLSDDGTYAIVVGIGDCWDKVIYIPSEHKGFPVREISTDSFKGKTYITEIFVPSSITTIQAESFSGCSALEKITLSKNLTTIYEKTFYNCTSLKNIVIPDSIISIGDSAFSGCSSLESITIPFVGGDANATSASSTTLFGFIFGTASYEGGVATEQYYSSSYYETYYIPSSLKNVSINSKNIFYGAFYNCSNLTSVTLDNNVASIGKNAFYNCTNLTEINFNAIAVEDLNSQAHAFNNAGMSGEGIKFTIGKNVTKIPAYLFDYTKIISVEFEKGNVCKSIGNYAFEECSSLTSVNYLGTIEEWCNISFGSFLSNPLANGARLYLNGELVTNLVIPDTVTEIKDYAFNGCTCLTSLTIPNSVTSIGRYVFQNCSSLISVTIGENVSSIGNYAFKKCSSLTSVNYLGTIEDWCNIIFNSSESNPLNNGASLYLNEELVTNLVIPDTVTKIQAYMFYGCTSLTSVTLGENVTSIGNSAFADCISLTSVNYLGTIEDWCNISFNSYSSNPLNNEAEFLLNGNLVEELIIPNTVTVIKNHAFNGGQFTTVEIPDSVTTIEESAFSNCESLVNLKIGNSVTLIEESAFYRCSSLKSLTIPEKVVTIEKRAFDYCTSLVEIKFNATDMYSLPTYDTVFAKVGQNGEGIKVIIGKNVTQIPSHLFGDYYGLQTPNIISVEFEEGSVCESIGNSAFDNCKYLKTVKIPDSVTSINGAFGDCISLQKVTLGTGVTSINAFSNCSFLQEIHISDLAAWCNISFGNYGMFLNNETSLYLNGELITNLVIPDTVTEIKPYAFNNYALITNVTIPNSVTSIGNYAFYNCTSLTSITIGSNVTSIDSNAFDECHKLVEVYNLSSLDVSSCFPYEKVIHTSLDEESILEEINDYIFMVWEDKYYLLGYIGTETELTLPENYNGNNYEIYRYAFYQNDKITKVIISNGVTSIGANAFRDCYSLTSVTIGSNVSSIYRDSFYNCYKLVEIYNLSSYEYNGYPTSHAYLITITPTPIGEPSSLEIVDDYIFRTTKNGYFLVGYVGDDAELILPESYKGNNYAIAEYAFYERDDISKVIIPNGVTSIGKYAFYGCHSLISIIISDSVTSIQKDAFYEWDLALLYCESESRPDNWRLPTESRVYWYSESKPTNYGRYWHYVDGEVVVW